MFEKCHLTSLQESILNTTFKHNIGILMIHKFKKNLRLLQIKSKSYKFFDYT